jgi:hypothetical protein
MKLDRLIGRRLGGDHLVSWWAHRQMQRSGLMDFMRGRPAEGIPPVSYDLWNLYRTVRTLRPQVVLEFGVGCSTFVLAEALARNGSGHLYSCETSPYWLDAVDRHLPPRLKERCTLILSAAEMMTYGNSTCSRYVATPDVSPQLIYLDGPFTPDIPGWPEDKAVCAADPVLLEPRLTAGCRLIVDGRFDNVEFLQRNLKRNWRTRTNTFKVTTMNLLN